MGDPFPVKIIFENGFAPVAPVHYMANRAGILKS